MKYCPYCNKNNLESSCADDTYTGLSVYVDIDHIIEKTNCPLIYAMNLKNMLPACTTCNRFLKGSKSLSIWKPFGNSINGEFYFYVTFSEQWDSYQLTDLSKITISIENKSKIVSQELKSYLFDNATPTEGREVFFNIEDRYNCCEDIKELIKEKFLNNYQLIAIDLNYNDYQSNYSDLDNFHLLKGFKLFNDLFISNKYKFITPNP